MVERCTLIDKVMGYQVERCTLMTGDAAAEEAKGGCQLVRYLKDRGLNGL